MSFQVLALLHVPLMALVPVDFFVFQSFLTWAQQRFQTMENCDGKSMKQQLLL